jgi:hypothetical protein
MKKGTALDGSVNRATVKKNLIAASGTVVVKGYAGRGTRLRLELTTQDEIGVITLELMTRAFRDNQFLVATGNQGHGDRYGGQPGNKTDCSHCLFVLFFCFIR